MLGAEGVGDMASSFMGQLRGQSRRTRRAGTQGESETLWGEATDRTHALVRGGIATIGLVDLKLD